MRAADREWVRELLRRELNTLRNEVDIRLLEVSSDLREDQARALGEITERIDIVHERALRTLTAQINRSNHL